MNWDKDKLFHHIRQGGMVVVQDDHSRENEGDLVCAAEFVTAATVNFFITHARGLLCVPLHSEIIDHFRLEPMVPKNESKFETGFCVSVNAKHGTTTGISAHDRALTAQVLSNPHSTRADLTIPGHVFPLRARPGLLAERQGHTEASVELVQKAGCRGVAMICEILNEDGSMARLEDLKVFAAKWNLPFLTIDEVAAL